MISIILFYSCELHCMYFSTSGGREVTTKRQLDGLCSLLNLTSHVPRLLRVIICMRQQDNEGMN